MCRVFSDTLSQDEIENGYLITRELLRKREGITAISSLLNEPFIAASVHQ